LNGTGNGSQVIEHPGSDGGAEELVRLNVEQASYAYHSHGQSAPVFTLAATSFVAKQRELVTILGPNASGKSTLLKLIAGTLKPLSGRVELEGFETSRLDTRTRAQKIAMVHQESPLLFPSRAGEYVLQGRHPYGRMLRFETSADVEIAEKALEQVGATHLRDRWMQEISGGEKQRVILARALAQQPILLLLDEPTLHLDIGAQVELLERLRQLAADNRYTVVVVTHELSLAAEFADQVVLLHEGKCLRVGTPTDVYRRDLLEQVFEAPLDVEQGPEGRPRVHIRGARGARFSGHFKET
jgi:iron complex transport system ATP-binding protein